MNVITLALNGLKLLWRNKAMLVLLLALPILMIALMGYAMAPIFDQNKTVDPFPVLYLNQDQGAAGLAFDDFLHNQQVLQLIEVNAQGLNTLELDAQLDAELASGNYPLAIKVPENFSSNLNQGQPANIEIIQTGQDLVQEEITRSIVASFVSSYNSEAGFARALQTLDNPLPTQNNTLQDLNHSIQTQDNTSKALVNSLQAQDNSLFGMDNPLQTLDDSAGVNTKIPPSANVSEQDFVNLQETGITAKLSSYQYFAASMLVFFLVTAGMGVATSLAQDRVDDIAKRIHSFPITKSQYLIGRLLSNGILALVQAMTIILFARFVFQVDWGTSPVGLILTILTVILVSSALGIVLANLFGSPKAVTAVITIVAWFMAFFSGGFTGAPVLGRAADLTINKWAFDALANLMLGKGVAEVLAYLLPLLTAALILWLVAILTYKRRVSYE